MARLHNPKAAKAPSLTITIDDQLSPATGSRKESASGSKLTAE
jgi:hypothetical protein